MIVEKMLTTKLDKHTVLNVNIPPVPAELLKGMKICRQAYAKYEEDFIERAGSAWTQYYGLPVNLSILIKERIRMYGRWLMDM